jgi:hypothetical protein
MSIDLRDHFAASVLPACYADACKKGDMYGWPKDWKQSVAREAYAMADIMLVVRETTAAALVDKMDDKVSDGWEKWDGELCPVDDFQDVEIKTKSHGVFRGVACSFDWGNREIIAYKVIE